ncbi:unnamed protein product [Closterium sp. NIES-54]
MASHRLVSGLPSVFPLLPPSHAPPCTPCVSGRLCATLHSSSLRPATAPFQTLHLDVWGPAPTQGPERERNFLVVVDDLSRYTMVFPLTKKSEVTSTLIRWLLATEGTCGRRVSRLHSDRGCEFCSGILAGFCGEQDIPYAIRYAAHQLNLQPRISRPEASPTSLWTVSPRVGSAFRVWGCLAQVRDTSADKLSARAIPCIFLGFPVASADWSFYHPPLHQFLGSRDIRFDESVSYYARYPCRGLLVPPPPLFLAPFLPPAPAPPVPPPPPGPAPSAFGTSATGGVGSRGAATGGTRSGGARLRGAGVGGAGAGGASPGGAGAVGAGTGGAGSGVGRPSIGGARTGGAVAGDPDPGGLPACARGAGAVGAGAVGVAAVGPAGAATAAAGAATAAAGAATAAAATATTATTAPSGAAFSSPPPQFPPSVVRHYHSRPCPPSARPLYPVTDLHTASLCMSLRRSPPPVSVLPSPPPSSLPVSPTPISDYYRAVHPVVSRVLSTGVIDPRFSPSSVSALTAAVADFAAASRLDYNTRVVPAPPTRSLSVGGTYVDAVPPPRANVVDGMWLFKVKQPPRSPPAFKARYVARGFSQHEGVDFFQTLAPTPKMTTLRVLLYIAAQRDYELHSLDFSTAILQGRLHEGIWLRRPPGFTGTFPPGTQWSLRRPVYSLRQSPCEWHDTLRSTLRDLGFRPSSVGRSLFVRAGSTPFFILVYVDDLVFAAQDRTALAEVKSELQKRHTCTDLGELRRYLGLQINRDRAARTITLTQSHMVQQVLQRVTKYLATTSGMGLVLGGTRPVELIGLCDSSHADDVETQRSTLGCCFCLGAGAVSWRSTRSSSVALSNAEAEIYANTMATQELRWLTFLLADLGERLRTAPTLFADNKAMILLCREPRLETRMKHVDVRYFLLRELQRRG